MEYAAVAAAFASILTALISAGKEGEAQHLRNQIAAEYGPEILPELDKAVAEGAGDSAFAGLRERDDGRREQLDVLRELENVYETGGRTRADEAALDVAGRRVSQRAGQQKGDVAISAAQRGQRGTGLEAVLASQSAQDELEALASLDAEVASSGRNRALQALQANGALASGVRGDDWRSMSEVASATDLQNRFNASQQQQTNMYNATLPQQEFDNEMRRLGAQGAAREGAARGIDASAAGVRQTGAGIGNAALSAGAAWDWKNKKEDE